MSRQWLVFIQHGWSQGWDGDEAGPMAGWRLDKEEVRVLRMGHGSHEEALKYFKKGE